MGDVETVQSVFGGGGSPGVDPAAAPSTPRTSNHKKAAGLCGCLSWSAARTITTMRLLNFVNGCLLVVCAVCVFFLPSDAATPAYATITLACYVAFLGTLMCGVELGVSSVQRRVRVNCGFLFSLAGRTLFIFFAASMSLAMYPSRLMLAMGGLTAANALFNAVVIIGHPSAFASAPTPAREAAAGAAGTAPKLPAFMVMGGGAMDPAAAAASVRAIRVGGMFLQQQGDATLRPPNWSANGGPAAAAAAAGAAVVTPNPFSAAMAARVAEAISLSAVQATYVVEAGGSDHGAANNPFSGGLVQPPPPPPPKPQPLQQTRPSPAAALFGGGAGAAPGRSDGADAWPAAQPQPTVYAARAAAWQSAPSASWREGANPFESGDL